MSSWYNACDKAAALIRESVPAHYRSRTFPGIIGDIKVLSSKKALSLISRKKGLGKQYAWLYLTQGIDQGMGYQACAVEALDSVLGTHREEIIHGRILDTGCAVGVTAGILSLDHIVGFDLFTDLLKAAGLTDSLTGAENLYIAADMTHDWPFGSVFDTVVCGMVCHHLKNQKDVITFFRNANRVLRPGGSLIVTLPAGSVAFAGQLENIIDGLAEFGFQANREYSGLVRSVDDPRSLFWMFLVVVRKVSDTIGRIFISPEFGFPDYRTPVTREQKGEKARLTSTTSRKIKHERFELIDSDSLRYRYGQKTFVFSELSVSRKER